MSDTFEVEVVGTQHAGEVPGKGVSVAVNAALILENGQAAATLTFLTPIAAAPRVGDKYSVTVERVTAGSGKIALARPR